MMMSSFAEQTRQLTSGISSMFGEVLKAMKQPSASQQANCYPMSMGSHNQATSPSFDPIPQGYSTRVSNTHAVIQPNYPASATSASFAQPPTTTTSQPSQPANEPKNTQLQNAPATTDWTRLSRYTVGDLYQTQFYSIIFYFALALLTCCYYSYSLVRIFKYSDTCPGHIPILIPCQFF